MSTITQPSNISFDYTDNANYTDIDSHEEESPIKAQNTQETIYSLESSSSSVSEEDFSFTALRAKLLGGKAPTNFNLDEHYKKQRKEKILDEKKKIEAKSFLRSFTPVVKRNHDWPSPRNVENEQEEDQKDHETFVDEGNEKNVSLNEYDEHVDDDMIQGTESQLLEKQSLEPSPVQQQSPVVGQYLETAVVAKDKENGLDHSREINEPVILQQDLSTLNKESMTPSNDQNKSNECITRVEDTDTIPKVTADRPEHQVNHIKQPIILNQTKPSVVAIHTSIIDPIRFQPNEQSSKINDANMISTDSSPVKKDLVIREYTYDMSNMPEWKYVMKPPERRYMSIFNFCNCDN